MTDVPKRIDHYQILSKLRQEALGTVCLAYDTNTQRNVAVKLMSNPELSAEISPVETSDEDEREQREQRFINEGELVARLRHPSIGVDCQFRYDSQGTPFIVMDELVGQDLEFLLDSAPPALARALRIVSQVCVGLTYLHGQQVVHRDIKPSNIWVTPERAVRILDLGFARAQRKMPTVVTGLMFSTPPYMAPERIVWKAVDQRSDLFSLGVVLYEALAGSRPFTADSFTSLVYQIVHDEPPELVLRDGSHIAELQSIVSRALAKDKNERFGTADEMGDAINTFLDRYEDPGS